MSKARVPPLGDNVLVIDGEFNNVTEGNRLSRTAIGFGAGASTLDTDVYVVQRIQGDSKPIFQFSTQADSGKMPGTGAPGAAAGGGAAIASMGVNMTMSAIKGHRSSMGSLADMTKGEIVDHLTQYFAQQGWTGNIAASAK